MSKSHIAACVAFSLGALVGACAGYFVSKKKYEERLNREVDSVRNTYKQYYTSKKYNTSLDDPDDNPPKVYVNDTPVETDISTPIPEKNLDYSTYFDKTKQYTGDLDDFPEYDPKEELIPMGDPSYPRVISPDEYYENEEYTKLEICLFDDGMMTDDAWDPIEEPRKIISNEDLQAFMEQDEEDEIFTVCDARRCLYAIEKQGQTWTLFLKNNPIIIETEY